LVNYSLDIHVFVEYTNIVSLLYYSFMSLFIVLVHELVVFLDVNLFGLFFSVCLGLNSNKKSSSSSIQIVYSYNEHKFHHIQHEY